MVQEVVHTILQPAVDGMSAEGHRYVGVLYAGLMLTNHGIQVLEFNCRFGDPETQVIMPLLQSDLVQIALACIDGTLNQVRVSWQSGAAACVVAASPGYPGTVATGDSISGLDREWTHAVVFHAGTRQEAGHILTAGGRVLGATGWGETVDAALSHAYQVMAGISYPGIQYRRDIGHQARSAYVTSGVSIDAGNQAVALMKSAVQATYSREVLAGIGSFGGLYDARNLQNMHQPVLVASTDGVGTKVKLAAQAGSYRTIGLDLVNHCINDILVQGARPLFFLDYFASSKIDPELVAEVVTGVAEGCRAAGIALLGGETAEMPGVYTSGEFDLAGTIIGVVERDAILPRPGIKAGDLLLGLASSGPHTNGYSLIRKVFEGIPLETIYPELVGTLKDALLAPHRSYLPVLRLVLEWPSLKGLAHLTGGGFIENIPRVIPEGVGAEIKTGSWVVPSVFKLIQQRGNIPTHEMYRVFNMGIGMVIIVENQQVEALMRALPEESFVIGQLVDGDRKVVLI